MSRYENSGLSFGKGTIGNKRDTTIYSNVPESNEDIYVITQFGDRLDLLAKQFYGDPTLWWFIANTNGLNTMNVEAGTRLRISTNLDKAKDILDKTRK